MRAVVTGMVGSFPLGGVAWDYGQYALGLERLGFDVWYLEDTGWEAYDPSTGEWGTDWGPGVAFLGESLAELSPTLAERWHFRAMDGASFGVDPDELHEVVASADVFLNVSGAALLRDEYLDCPVKILIDTDPGWNQLVLFPRWDARGPWYGTHGYRAHDHFFTYAERIGRPDCPIPDLGLPWQPTRPPVVVDRWEEDECGDRWTTVMSWRSFMGHVVASDERRYGGKEVEFERIEALPRLVDAPLEVAVGGPAPADRWRELGWSVRDSHDVSGSAASYRDYVARSRGEVSVAKNVYVETRGGWFSCRSVCYLAAGRPAVLQDTGFADVVPTGQGLFAFADAAEAARAIGAVERDYERHAQAARELARTEFGHDVVLGSLLERAGVGVAR